ncbi:SRPBCC family protein [Streptomyces formicae]
MVTTGEREDRLFAALADHFDMRRPSLSEHLKVLREAGLVAEEMLSVRWLDPDPANFAYWTLTWTLEHEGRGTRLFLVHEGFDPDDPAQMMARKIMDGGWRSHVMRALEQVLTDL